MMTRRNFMQILGAAAAALAVPAGAIGLIEAAPAQGPDIVWFVLDKPDKSDPLNQFCVVAGKWRDKRGQKKVNAIQFSDLERRDAVKDLVQACKDMLRADIQEEWRAS